MGGTPVQPQRVAEPAFFPELTARAAEVARRALLDREGLLTKLRQAIQSTAAGGSLWRSTRRFGRAMGVVQFGSRFPRCQRPSRLLASRDLWRQHPHRHKRRGRRCHQQTISNLPPPYEQQPRIHAMPRGHFGHAHTSLLGLADDTQLLFNRASPALTPRDDLDCATAH
jgi:hypothetical protein